MVSPSEGFKSRRGRFSFSQCSRHLAATTRIHPVGEQHFQGFFGSGGETLSEALTQTFHLVRLNPLQRNGCAFGGA
jgi:hypothetical protein